MRRTLFLLALAAAVAGCNDGPSGPACPDGPTITETGTFDLAVERGSQGTEWTHSVTLPDGYTWISAEMLACSEVYHAACSESRVVLEAGVMTFSGTITSEYTQTIRVEWEAKGC
ncbi:MAG: hypothetical protein R3314_09215 [Longimicrobiales bacterium]|nr:hypothetical protein [Longimicrobiales bacterium]